MDNAAAQKVINEFRNGADFFVRHPLVPLRYSNGVEEFVELGAYWMLDIIGTEIVDWLRKHPANNFFPMAVIKVVGKDSKGTMTAETEDDDPHAYQRNIDYTDFEGEVTFFLQEENKGIYTLILSSEY